ncbi:hypothetical protein [Acinetobacter pittii]|uniref:hypothetical protein n=1 Tax=Acinetobacter pittii TaxID=48296 RepID=UPI00238077D4|nr:hypothetical protein [Acinetobacter pittii]MDE4038812.1 hypothetical protein [Acinetobacter pittii]
MARQIKTPGAVEEVKTEEVQGETPEVDLAQQTTAENAEETLSEILSAPHEAIIPAPEGIPEWIAAILDGQARLEQKIDAVLSQSPNEAPKAKAKGRFQLVEGKGHVWVEE